MGLIDDKLIEDFSFEVCSTFAGEVYSMGNKVPVFGSPHVLFFKNQIAYLVLHSYP